MRSSDDPDKTPELATPATMRPFTLSSSVALTPSQIKPLDSAAMGNKFRLPMLLDSLWVSIYQAGTSLGTGYVAMGSQVALSVRSGRLALTNGFVPVWILGTQLLGQFGEYVTENPGFTNYPFYYEAYEWRLPRPMWIQPGQGLQIDVLKDALGTGTYNIQVVAKGRIFPDNSTPTPQTIHVPYVTAFIPGSGTSPFVLGNGALTTSVSNTNDLRNPFDDIFYAQRMIGRVRGNTDGTISEDVGSLLVSMTSTSGLVVTNDYLPFEMVFEFSRRALTFRRKFNNKESISASIIKTNGANLIPMISLVGYRHEKLS